MFFDCDIGMWNFSQFLHSITAIVNIVTVAIILSPSISPVVRALAAIPNITIYNIMACRIHRKVKLGNITNGSRGPLFPSPVVLSRPSAPFGPASAPLHLDSFSMELQGQTTKNGEGISTSTRLGQVQYNGNVGC